MFTESAMRTPHVQGGFREELVCTQAQAIKLPASTAVTEAAFAEPLSVCLHAARQAGPLLGKRVLVTGTGPVVGEAMVAFVLADAYRQKFGGDHIDDVLVAVAAYKERIAWRRS